MGEFDHSIEPIPVLPDLGTLTALDPDDASRLIAVAMAEQTQAIPTIEW